MFSELTILIPVPILSIADIIAMCSFPVPDDKFIATSLKPISFFSSVSPMTILSLSISMGSLSSISMNFISLLVL